MSYALLMLAASIPWIILAWLVHKKNYRVPLSWIFIAAVLLRFMAQFASPALSDDLYRYVWEGRQQHLGRNPFLDAPEKFEAEARDDPVWQGINHREIPAAYPPLCQVYLWVLASFGGDVLFFRSGFALMDLLLVFLIAIWLARMKLDPALSLIYSLCPMVLLELSVEGHNDSLGLVLLVASFILLGPQKGAQERGKKGSTQSILFAGFLLGLSIAAKYLPILLLPWFWRRDKRTLLPCLLAVFLGFVIYFPGFDRVPELFHGLLNFSEKWRHNDSLFHFVYVSCEAFQEWLKGMGYEGWLSDGWKLDQLARYVMAAIFVAGACFIYRFERDITRVPVVLFGLLFALATTVHPWYLVWVVPFLCRRPSPALFALIAGVQFSYLSLVYAGSAVVTETGERGSFWEGMLFWKLLEYLPFYLFALHAMISSLRRTED